MAKLYTNIVVPEEYIPVVVDLDHPEGTTSMKRHIDAFPPGYLQVEKIAHLAIVRLYPDGATDIKR